MAWKTPLKRLAQLALLTFASGEISAAAADVLVLRAVGPRVPHHYRVGSRHADNAIFELRPGDSLVVLARSGTREWRGPGFFSLVAPPRPLVLANGQTVRVQTGVVRGPPPQPGVQPTEVWEYDASKEGHLCVAAGTAPMLWRPRSAAPATVTITAPTGTSRRVTFPAGEYRMPWPATLPLTARTTYVIESGSVRRTARVTPRVLPAAAAAAGTDRLAAQLLAEGCASQLETLIATRIDPTAPIAAAPAVPGSRSAP